MKSASLRLLLLLLLLLVVAGCAKHSGYYKEGVEATKKENYDEAVVKFSLALKEKPGDPEYKARFSSASHRASWEHLKKGRELRSEGLLIQAASEMRLAYSLNNGLQVALTELKEIEALQVIRATLAEADSLYQSRRLPQAEKLVKSVLDNDPTNPTALLLLEQIRRDRNILVDGFELAVESKEPITLKFKDARLQEVFKILNKLSGINFIFDEGLSNENVTLLLEDATFSQALELLMKMNNLGSRVLNPKTVIIYSNTKEKQKQYEDQIIQTFYLSNIEAKKAVNMLRTMLTLRKVYVHEELNALVVRDRPEVIRLVEQMLQNADLSDSEVVFDLELIEVSHGDSMQFGPEFSPYGISAAVANASGIVDSTLPIDGSTGNLIGNLQGLDVLFTLPTATFDFSKQLLDTDILATPKIRVKNREKGKVHVGTREPSITSTVTGDNVSENVQYIDVGVKVDVEPIIQLDGSVQTKLRLEVSSASDPVESSTSRVFTINTTNAETTLILKDGERTIIGGLIRSVEITTKQTIPFIGDIPLLGALVTHYDTNEAQREILLSVTPHIVKKIELPGAKDAGIWSGGEEELKSGQNFAAFAESPEPPERKPTSDTQPIDDTKTPIPEAIPEPPIVEQPDTDPVSTPPLPVVPEATSTQPPSVEPQSQVDTAPLETTRASEQTTASVVPVETLPENNIVAPKAVPKVFLSGSQLVKVGEEFMVELQVGEIEKLSSAPLFVNYDQHLLEYVRTEEGDFLKQTGQSTIFTSSPNPGRGEVIFGSKQGVGSAGANGSGALARIYFKAIASGTAVIRPNRVNFRSSAGTRLKTQVEPFQVEIQ